MPEPTAFPARAPLDRARRKAYLRLIPILFFCYMIAYVDRTNVSLARLTMSEDMPAFTDAVIGKGAGIFFIGYFLLEIPGTLLVELWSARKWISRIMITWGIVAALTAFVKTPTHFYVIRFLLGLAEAGFFPGVIVYLTHWFPSRDRTRALAWFLVATPMAQILSPFVSSFLLDIGRNKPVAGVPGSTVHIPELYGFKGWQCIYIFWGVPAVILGVLVLFYLTDRPGQARWLRADEREALEAELAREKAESRAKRGHMTLLEALRYPKVLLLCSVYFFIVMGNYGVEYFMPRIFQDWFKRDLTTIAWLAMIPPLGSLVGQLFVGWNSDRTKERWLHATVPIAVGAATLLVTLAFQDRMWICVGLFVFVVAGTKAYLPAFWSLPSLFLTEAAAAGSIGLINSVGNLGGYFGPDIVGMVRTGTGSFHYAIIFLSASMAISSLILFGLGLAGFEHKPKPKADLADAELDGPQSELPDSPKKR